MTEQTQNEIVSRNQRRQELDALTFTQNGQLFQPTNGRELMDMANMMAGAGFMVKDIYRNNAGACLGLIAICSPYGLNPLQVSWKTYKASKSEDAPIAFEAQVIVAMVNASGVVKGGLRYSYEGAGDSRVCIASGKIVGSDEVLEVRSPPLGKITPKNSPLWKSDPDQQLAYYTGRSWCRRYKPEMLLGVYDIDEVESMPMRDITPRTEEKASGFASMAARAREDAKAITPTDEVDSPTDAPSGEASDPETDDPTAIDGEIMPDEIEIDTKNASYRNGHDAAALGFERAECPQDLDQLNTAHWFAGFDAYQEEHG